MNHDRLIDAYIHLLRHSTDHKKILDQLFWVAFEKGLDAGIDLERGTPSFKIDPTLDSGVP